MKAWLRTWRQTAKLFSSYRKLWIPFVLAALVEALGLGLIWLAPHRPFSIVLGPPIRYFFGDYVLHYPWHLWFLYHAMKHTHLIASILAGAFFSGIACVMVRQIYQGEDLSLRAALMKGHVRYRTVVVVWGITWVVARGMMEALVRVLPKSGGAVLLFMGITVLLQAFFIYAIPAIVFRGSIWRTALVHSIKEALRYPWSTLTVVAVWSAPLFLFTLFVSPTRVSFWMFKMTPEIAVAVVLVRLFVWMAVDAFLTVGIAHLWWSHRSQEEAVGVVERDEEDPIVA